jgi:hypothetical protein
MVAVGRCRRRCRRAATAVGLDLPLAKRRRWREAILGVAVGAPQPRSVGAPLPLLVVVASGAAGAPHAANLAAPRLIELPLNIGAASDRSICAS